jgi:predicted AlkP superfamily pyrophosphatase or phosphodiesterase
MRVLRWLGYGVLAVVLLIGGALAYTARPPYAQPALAAALPAKEFVASVARRATERSVVLFVFDGFAPATLRAADAPNFARMAREGAHSLDMMPVFPSLSMPNHFALATGCYPARNGVVSNHFRDPERGIYSSPGDADWLLGCEPLHVVAERQGVRAAVFGWVGGVSGSRGKLASVVEPLADPPLGARAQADRIIAQLSRPATERPGLIAAYVTEPDATSHTYGPTAPETLRVAHELDTELGRVMDAIDRLGLRDRVTLIATTDHGMLGVDKSVSIERLLRLASIGGLVLADGSVGHVYLDDPAQKARAIGALRKHAFLDVIDPAAAPEYARLGSSARVGDLVVSVHAGYFTFDTGFWPWYLRFASFIGPGVSPSRRFGGMHGYDPARVPEVRAIFYAWGKDIAAGSEIAGMRTIDVHPTVARLLAIEPGTPIDGKAREELLARPAVAALPPANEPAGAP